MKNKTINSRVSFQRRNFISHFISIAASHMPKIKKIYKNLLTNDQKKYNVICVTSESKFLT